MNVPYMTEQIVPTLKSFYSVLASLMLAEVESTSTNLHLRCAEHVVCLLVAAEVFLKLEGPMALVALIWLLVSLGMAIECSSIRECRIAMLALQSTLKNLCILCSSE